MRNNNWTMLAIAALILGLLYYFMQEPCCTKSGKGSKADVATSMEFEAEAEFEEGYPAEEGMDDQYFDDFESTYVPDVKVAIE